MSNEQTQSVDVVLLCNDCGSSFTRTSEYLMQQRTDPLFKWTCTKCDGCREKRVNLAFNRMASTISTVSEAGTGEIDGGENEQSANN